MEYAPLSTVEYPASVDVNPETHTHSAVFTHGISMLHGSSSIRSSVGGQSSAILVIDFVLVLDPPAHILEQAVHVDQSDVSHTQVLSDIICFTLIPPCSPMLN